MSTMQRMTLIGLYNYDASLFDLLTLPEGYDKDTFIDSFLLEHGEKCVLYTDPDFMKFSIGAVSRKWELELSRIYEALTAEYNPIYNYDRYEEFSDTEGVTTGGTRTDKPDYNTTQTVDSTNEIKVAAFNSSSYEPSEKNTSNNGTVKTSGTTENVEMSGSTDITLEHEAHIYGNVGVTTATKMTDEIIAQRMKSNLYGLAGRIFANELLIQLY